DAHRIFNPLTARSLTRQETLFGTVQALWNRTCRVETLAPTLQTTLVQDGWVVPAEGDLSRRFRLTYVSLEANTTCNHTCFFCPVSLAPRAGHTMSLAFYERIVQQLADFRATLAAVFVNNYNEPTADRWFVDRVRILKAYDLAPALLTNGSGLTPARVDELMALGGLRYLCINLSTLDQEQYRHDRGADHLNLVLRNLDYCKQVPLAPEMVVVVLGRDDRAHRRAHREIARRFAGTRFRTQRHLVMDRAGYLPLGVKSARPHAHLRGCENMGSRPIQHLHITPYGHCLLCCEDYDERYVVGDLTVETVAEVLAGPRLAQLRRWVYGQEEAPADFICRRCHFARTP
ncbi:MAG: radical SAM/SPASM domain-containing protein, partial [Candidatus Binatia bacterium]